MPGAMARLRPDCDWVLNQLDVEGQANMGFLRRLIGEIIALGPSVCGDPNKTRALTISPLDGNGARHPQYLAVVTANHRGYHRLRELGQIGFSIQLRFREPQPTLGPDWRNDRFDYHKADGSEWYRFEPADTSDTTLNAIVGVARRARASMGA